MSNDKITDALARVRELSQTFRRNAERAKALAYDDPERVHAYAEGQYYALADVADALDAALTELKEAP